MTLPALLRRAALYRRFAIGWPFGVTHRLTRSSPPQNTIPRYSAARRSRNQNGVRTSSGAGTREGNLCEGAILSTRACRSSCGRRRPHSERFALPVSNAEEQSAANEHPALKRNEFRAPEIVASCEDFDRY